MKLTQLLTEAKLPTNKKLLDRCCSLAKAGIPTGYYSKLKMKQSTGKSSSGRGSSGSYYKIELLDDTLESGKQWYNILVTVEDGYLINMTIDAFPEKDISKDSALKKYAEMVMSKIKNEFGAKDCKPNALNIKSKNIAVACEIPSNVNEAMCMGIERNQQKKCADDILKIVNSTLKGAGGAKAPQFKRLNINDGGEWVAETNPWDLGYYESNSPFEEIEFYVVVNPTNISIQIPKKETKYSVSSCKNIMKKISSTICKKYEFEVKERKTHGNSFEFRYIPFFNQF